MGVCKWLGGMTLAFWLGFTVNGEAVGESWSEKIGSTEEVQVARHRGGRHHGHHGRHGRHHRHHGMGRQSEGICPQTRSTAEAPDAIAQLSNPLEPTRENRDRGEELFQGLAEPTPCKICHGSEGNGMGMMAQQSGSVVPRNFTCKQTMDEISDGQMFWIITNGSPGTAMPSFKMFLSEKEIWQLILYIREFSK